MHCTATIPWRRPPPATPAQAHPKAASPLSDPLPHAVLHADLQAAAAGLLLVGVVPEGKEHRQADRASGRAWEHCLDVRWTRRLVDRCLEAHCLRWGTGAAQAQACLHQETLDKGEAIHVVVPRPYALSPEYLVVSNWVGAGVTHLADPR